MCASEEEITGGGTESESADAMRAARDAARQANLQLVLRQASSAEVPVTQAEAKPLCQCLRGPAWNAAGGAAPDSGAVRRAWRATLRRARAYGSLGNVSLHVRLWRRMYDDMKLYMYEQPARATPPRLRASRRGFALEVRTTRSALANRQRVGTHTCSEPLHLARAPRERHGGTTATHSTPLPLCSITSSAACVTGA